MKKFITVLFLGLVVVSACKKDDDTDDTRPSISISSPVDGSEYEPGDTIHLQGTITDNEALANYQIDIHEGDGHSHKSASRGEWDFEQTSSISGTSYTIDQYIPIATDADTAEYHVILNALDAAGNAASFVEIDIEIHEH